MPNNLDSLLVPHHLNIQTIFEQLNFEVLLRNCYHPEQDVILLSVWAAQGRVQKKNNYFRGIFHEGGTPPSPPLRGK